MTDAELIEFASEFRDGILDNGPSNRACYMVCAPLVGLLQFEGIECKLVEFWFRPRANERFEAYQHFWIKLEDGRALDPTIDQFNYLFDECWSKVYLGPLTKYHVEHA